MSDDSKLKIVFAPGCFDDFEGTQEELDAFVAEIQDMLESSDLQQLIKFDSETVAVVPFFANEEGEIDTDDVADRITRKRFLN